MEIKELLQFIELEDKRLLENFYKDFTKKERIFENTIKLSEELGELCSEILACNVNQRQEKKEKHCKENLQHEFADVIIATLMLAKKMNIDIEKALENKIEKINGRYKS